MADLARITQPVGARRRQSDNQDNLLPSRRQTDRQGIEVNAPIVGTNRSSAQILAKTLGLAQEAGEAGVGLLVDKQVRTNKADAAAGAMAGQAGGSPASDRMSSSYYREAYYTAGAERSALEASETAKRKVNELFADPNNPPTLEEVNAVIDGTFSEFAMNPDGSVRDFGSPQAPLVVAAIMEKTRSEVIPAASTKITKATNEKLISNVAFTAATQGLPLVGEVAVAPDMVPLQPVDPDAALLGPVASVSAPTTGGAKPLPVSQAERTGQPRAAAAPSTQFNMTTYTARMGKAENATGSNTASPGTSSALGKFQFTEGTWLRTYRSIYGNTGESQKAILAKRTNPKYQDRLIQRLTRDNIAYLKDKHGIEPTYSSTYLAHFLGPGDAAKVLKAPAGTPLAGLLDPKSIRANPWVFGKVKTAGGLREWAGKKMGVPVDGEAPGAMPNPDLRPNPVANTQTDYTPRYDFGALMKRIPPSVPEEEAKKGLVGGLKVYALQNKRPDLLRGIAFATRDDGTPWFSPDEQLDLMGSANQLEKENRTEAERIRKERWDGNADLLLKEKVEGRPVTRETIREWVDNGDIDPQFGAAWVEQLDNEEEQEARENTAAEKEAKAEEEAEIDADVSSMAVVRQSGDLRGASPEEDLRRWRNGEFGTGKKGAARYRMLRAATSAGARVVEQSPEAQSYAGRLSDEYQVRARGNGSMLQTNLGVSRETRDLAFATYRARIAAGDSPAVAYAAAKKAAPLDGGASPASRSSLLERRKQLEAKQ